MQSEKNEKVYPNSEGVELASATFNSFSVFTAYLLFRRLHLRLLIFNLF
ncbi:MAG: hypothetical protein ACI920_002630, partial [Saprospiraceae bacterium]